MPGQQSPRLTTSRPPGRRAAALTGLLAAVLLAGPGAARAAAARPAAPATARSCLGQLTPRSPHAQDAQHRTLPPAQPVPAGQPPAPAPTAPPEPPSPAPATIPPASPSPDPSPGAQLVVLCAALQPFSPQQKLTPGVQPRYSLWLATTGPASAITITAASQPPSRAVLAFPACHGRHRCRLSSLSPGTIRQFILQARIPATAAAGPLILTVTATSRNDATATATLTATISAALAASPTMPAASTPSPQPAPAALPEPIATPVALPTATPASTPAQASAAVPSAGQRPISALPPSRTVAHAIPSGPEPATCYAGLAAVMVAAAGLAAGPLIRRISRADSCSAATLAAGPARPLATASPARARTRRTLRHSGTTEATADAAGADGKASETSSNTTEPGALLPPGASETRHLFGVAVIRADPYAPDLAGPAGLHPAPRGQ